MQSLARSRDENLVADIEAALRVALQQSALTGSAEPLVAALQQADERLARSNQPRLERVRRAIARDLDRVQAASVDRHRRRWRSSSTRRCAWSTSCRCCRSSRGSVAPRDAARPPQPRAAGALRRPQRPAAGRRLARHALRGALGQRVSAWSGDEVAACA